MASLSERWFSRFSDDWEDPSTVKGFFGGLAQIVLQSVLFVLLLALSISAGITEFGIPETPNGLILVSALLLGVLLGGGPSYLQYTRDQFRRLGQTFTYRITILIGVYGLYTALLAYHPVCGIWFAIAAVSAKILVFLSLAVSTKL